MPSNFDLSVSIIRDAEESGLQVDTPEQFEDLIANIRNKFSALYPESIDPESVAEAIISHFEENVVPQLHEEIRSLILSLYSANVAREIFENSAHSVANQLRKDLEQPIRKQVARDREAITERIREEMIESIRQELKAELEPSVRRELRDEILKQLGMNIT
jgi:hypothetical protein